MAAPGSPAYASRLQPELDQIVRDLGLPGLVVLVESGQQGNWSVAFGKRDLRAPDPLTQNDHFRIGSVTKTVTATAVLTLVDEGRIGLDDPIGRYRPEVPNGDNITIRQLLNMTAGIHPFSSEEELDLRQDGQPQRAWKPEELMAIAYGKPATFPPGTAWEYSNSNYVLLGQLIETVTGNAMQDEITRRVLEPLGMRDTSLQRFDEYEMPKPFAHGYLYGTVTGLDDRAHEEADGRPVTPPPDVLNDRSYDNMSWNPTGGGMYSTPGDLAKLARGVVDGALLRPETQQARMTFVPVAPGSATGYGLGVFSTGALRGHSGDVPGYSTFMWRDPSRDLTFVGYATLSLTRENEVPWQQVLNVLINEFEPGTPPGTTPPGAPDERQQDGP